MGIKDRFNKLPLNTKAALVLSLSIFVITMVLTLLLQLALKQSELAVLESLRNQFPNYVAARQDILDAFTGDNLKRYLSFLPLFALLNFIFVYFTVSVIVKKLFGNYEELIQNTAHEIKTPLFALKTSLDVLKLNKKATIKDYENFTNSVEIITLRLNRLIESLLIVTKSSREFSTSEKCNLSLLVEDLIKSFNGKINQKKIKINQVVEKDIEYVIQRRYAEALLGNIIDNAIKYSPVQTVINLQLSKSKDNKFIVFTCADNGVGVPENELKQITQRFFRASNAVESGEDGSGLGLSAVKKIIKEYDGELKFTSNKPNGLIVELKLPLFSGFT